MSRKCEDRGPLAAILTNSGMHAIKLRKTFQSFIRLRRSGSVLGLSLSAPWPLCCARATALGARSGSLSLETAWDRGALGHG
jgi:hypothetical protein